MQWRNQKISSLSNNRQTTKRLQGMSCMAGICVLCFFFFLPAEDICVFKVSWRKLWAECMLCARVRRQPWASKEACEQVCQYVACWAIERSWTFRHSDKEVFTEFETERDAALIFLSSSPVLCFVHLVLSFVFLPFRMIVSVDVTLRNLLGFWTLF